MNFKVGDLVIPKQRLMAEIVYGGLTLYSGMKDELYSRPYWVVKKVCTDGTGVVGIDLEGTYFTYTPEMLEPLLSVGKVVQLEDDSLAFITESKSGLCISGPKDWFPLDCLDKDLNYKKSTSSPYYIKKVYSLSSSNMNAWKLETTDRKCIWERKSEKKEMTIAEIEKKLGYSIKVIKEEEF